MAIAANFIKKLRKHAVLSVRLHPTYFTIKFRVSWHTLQVRYSCFTKLIYLMPAMKIWCKDLQNLSSKSFCAIQKNNRQSMRRSPRNKTVVGYLTYISLLLPQKRVQACASRVIMTYQLRIADSKRRFLRLSFSLYIDSKSSDNCIMCVS